MLQAYRYGELELDQLTASVAGWVNHVRYGNTVGLRKAVLSQRVVGKKISGKQVADMKFPKSGRGLE